MKRKCDACKAEMPDEGTFVRVVRDDEDFDDECIDTEHYLCPRCTKQLVDFLEGKRAKL